MEHQRWSDDDKFEKFAWRIENFSHLNSEKLYSETVVIGGYPWRILLYPRGNKVDHLSIYLDAVNSPKFPNGWSRDVKFKLVVFNQVNSHMTITKESDHEFSAKEDDWGFKCFMPLSKLHDPHKGFLVKDTCIVGAEVFVCKVGHENVVNQAASITPSSTFGGQAGHMEVEIPELEGQGPDMEALPPISTQVCTKPIKHTNISSALSGELMDFRGLGKIEKAFVPLLEEVCSQHPSLSESQQNRSRRFTEWAFTALGSVLHFLKTRKVEDMDDIACKDLQILWEELETFKFDLTWLEPHVQFALSMKSYVEKAMLVEKLKENVGARELEMKRLKAELATAMGNLDKARTLLKEEGFEERDLNAELGYGRPTCYFIGDSLEVV